MGLPLQDHWGGDDACPPPTPASLKVKLKVLDFIKSGGPGWTRTIDLGLIRTAL